MFNTVYIEFYKLKRSKITFLAPIAALLPTFLVYLTHVRGGESAGSLESLYNLNSFMMNAIMAVVIFTLFSSFIFSREYSENTINTLFTCPISRLRFYIGKIIVIFSFITMTEIINLILITISASMLGYNNISAVLLLNKLEITLITSAMQLALVPIIIFITLHFKNIIPAIAVGIGAVVCNIVVFNGNTVRFVFPWIAPASLANVMAFGGSGNYVLGIASLTITFLVGLILSIIHYMNFDVHSGS